MNILASLPLINCLLEAIEGYSILENNNKYFNQFNNSRSILLTIEVKTLLNFS